MMYLQSLFEIFTYCVDPVHLSLKVIKLLLKPFAPANQFLDLPARADNDHHKKQAATFSPVGAKKKKSSENFAQHDFLSRRPERKHLARGLEVRKISEIRDNRGRVTPCLTKKEERNTVAPNTK